MPVGCEGLEVFGQLISKSVSAPFTSIGMGETLPSLKSVFSTHLDRIVPFSFCEYALWRELAPVVPAQLCQTFCDPQAAEGS